MFMQNSLCLSFTLRQTLVTGLLCLRTVCGPGDRCKVIQGPALPSRSSQSPDKDTRSTPEQLWRGVLKGTTQQLPVGASVWLIEQGSYTQHHCQCHHLRVRGIISPVNPDAIRRTRHAKYQMSVKDRTW